jgi:type II secretion system protein D
MLLTAATVFLGLCVIDTQSVGAQAKKDVQPLVKKDEMKPFAFEFSNAPWAEVLDWLKDRMGLPLATIYRPTGSFTFDPVKGADGKKKLYTVPEAIDAINEALLAQKFMIIRRAATFTVWPADEAIPPELIPFIDLEELPTRGKTEIVKVNYPLKTLNADTLAPGIAKMKGPFGQVVVIDEANRLILIDVVQNLRGIIKMIEEMDGGKSISATQFNYTCKYVRAGVAAEKVRELLGEQAIKTPYDIENSMPKAPGGLAVPLQPGGFGGPGGKKGGGAPAFDPTGGFGGGGFQFPQAKSAVKERQPVTVTHDDRLNQITVTGPPNKVAMAEKLIKDLDQEIPPETTRVVGKPEFKTFTVPAGDAETVAKNLQTIYKASTTMSINAIGNNSILVYAPPQDLIDITLLLSKLIPPPSVTMRITLEDADANTVKGTLEKFYAEVMKQSGLTFDLDPVSNAILIKGGAEQVEDVQRTIKSIYPNSLSHTGSQLLEGLGKTRVITLDKGSGSSLARALANIWGTMRQNPVKVVNPVQDIDKIRKELDSKRDGTPNKGQSDEIPPQKKAELERQLSKYHVVQLNTETKQKKDLPGDKDKSITLTPYGTKIIVSSEDPEAMKLMTELIRLIVNTPAGDGDFEVIRLKHSSAVSAAAVLDAIFNGTQKALPGGGQQGGGAQAAGGKGGKGGKGGAAGGFDPNMMGGGQDVGGFGGNLGQVLPGVGNGAQLPRGAQPERIRVVADPQTNSIIVKANLIDLLTIYELLGKSIDSGDNDSDAAMSIHYLKLTYAYVSDVAYLVQEIFRERMNTSPLPRTAGAGVLQNLTNAIGGGATTKGIDQYGQPTGVALSIGVDDRNNTLICYCSETMFKDVKKLVDNIEKSSESTMPVVKVIPISNIDPTLVQTALNMIQGANQKGNAMGQGGLGGLGAFGGVAGGNPFGGVFGAPGGGGFGGGGFGGGGFGGGGFGGGGPGGGGFGGGAGGGKGGGGGGGPGGGGGGPGGGAGGGGGGKGGGGGGKGGGLSRSGPDFFEQRVMDDPYETAVLFDPEVDIYPELEALLAPEPQESEVAQEVHNLHHIQLVDHQVVVPGQKQDPKAQDPKMQDPNQQKLPVPQPVPGQKAELGSGPRLPAVLVPLPTLGLLVVRALNQDDLNEIMKIVNALQKAATDSEIQLEIVPLQNGDATGIASVLQQVLSKVTYQVNATIMAPTTGTGAGAAQAPATGVAATQGRLSGTVYIEPLPRFNSLLIAAYRSRMKDIVEKIRELDRPPSEVSGLVPFSLSRQPAQNVANQINTFWGARYGETNQVKATADAITNTVFVQASPGDMKEIARFIQFIDSQPNRASNDVKVIPLKNALSDDLSYLLQLTLSEQIVLPPNQPVLPGATGAAAGGGGAVNLTGVFTPTAATTSGVSGNATGVRYKNVQLSFQTPNGRYDATALSDVYVFSDVRTNSLVVSAPPQTMALIEALVRELDRPPQYLAAVNVFKLKKHDAAAIANILQQLFTGTTGTFGTTTTAPGGGAGAAKGTTTSSAQFPQLTIGGIAVEGANVIPFKMTIDDRTNSLIVAGSPSDLKVVEAVVAKLEDTLSPSRETHVFQINHVQAVDIANTLIDYFSKQLSVYTTANGTSAWIEFERDIRMSAEPVSNKLIVSVAPQYLETVARLIHELDNEEPQVSIETMIAEVDLSNDDEIGCEVGLQSPVVFQRGIYPSNNVSSPGFTSTPSTAATNGGTIAGLLNTPLGTPGFNFNQLTTPTSQFPLGNNVAASPGVVGFQGISSLGVGRSSTNQPGVGGFVFSANSGVFSLLVRALQAQGRIEILSAPKVTCTDNQAARVLVGQSFPYLTGSTSTTATTGIPTVINTVNYRDVGIQVQVTPKINPDGSVIMRVVPEVSSPVTTTVEIVAGVFAIAFNEQTIETTVIADDGETVILGGLISRSDTKQENKVPWLGDLPWVGAAFRYRTQSTTKTELLIVLTPHVLRCRKDREDLLQQHRKDISFTPFDYRNVYGERNADWIGGANCPSGPAWTPGMQVLPTQIFPSQMVPSQVPCDTGAGLHPVSAPQQSGQLMGGPSNGYPMGNSPVMQSQNQGMVSNQQPAYVQSQGLPAGQNR